jgi:hypothetical protein
MNTFLKHLKAKTRTDLQRLNQAQDRVQTLKSLHAPSVIMDAAVARLQRAKDIMYGRLP